MRFLVTTATLLLTAEPPIALRTPAVGPLRVHPTNPRYFTAGVRSEDGSLKVVYLTGSHHWDNLQDGYNPEVAPFDFSRYLNLLAKHDHNCIRLWAWEHLAAQASWHYEHKKQAFDPLPFARTGPGQAVDGKPKLDLTKLNPTYFDRLRQRVVAARDRGMYVSIMLFQGVAGTGPAAWPGHVFNKNNNINGLDGNGTDTQTLKNAAIVEIQKAYLRKVVDTVNDLDNVLYEIANEAHVASTAWQYEMIRYLKSYQAGKPKQHPVGMTCRSDEPDNEILWRSPADWISPGTYRVYAVNPPAADGRKVSFLDTDHVFGVGGDRGWVWKAFTRGHNPIYMDPLWGYVPDKEPWKGQKERGEGARVAMGQTRRFAERTNLASMTPKDDLTSTGYCLANPGREYLIYQSGNGRFDVTLLEGVYRTEWFNPVSGATIAAGDVHARSGPQPFVAPFSGAAVLYLTRQVSEGSVKVHERFPSRHVAPRHVHVWLPPAYTNEPNQRFPVIYAHDGQNLFDPKTSFLGVDWGVDEAMAKLVAQRKTTGAVVVAVWNTPKRVHEYLPRKMLLRLRGTPRGVQVEKELAKFGVTIDDQAANLLSDAYLAFLVTELNPFVDRTYRTLPERQHTFIMGSSAGALISLYALTEYPEVFGGAACVSTHWPIGDGAMIEYVKDRLPDPRTHRLYFDFGTETLDKAYEPYQRRMDAVIAASGYRLGENWLTRKFDGADHSERSWRKRVHVPLEFLLTDAGGSAVE
jgi:predicted alpha/beta superfamily hydrolase